MNLLSSHFTISYNLHSCETVNKKVNCGLTPNRNGNCGKKNVIYPDSKGK